MIEYGLFAICMAIFLTFLFGIAIGILIREVWLVHKYGWKYEKRLRTYKKKDEK